MWLLYCSTPSPSLPPLQISHFQQAQPRTTISWVHEMYFVIILYISRFFKVLGDVLEWHLLVGKTPTSCPPSSSNRPVVRSKSDGELIANSGPCEAKSNSLCFSIPSPPWQLSQNLQCAGSRQVSTPPPSGFSQDPLVSVLTVLEDSWEALPWPVTSITTPISSNDSPPTPLLLHSPRWTIHHPVTGHSNVDLHQCYLASKSILPVWNFQQGAPSKLGCPCCAIYIHSPASAYAQCWSHLWVVIPVLCLTWCRHDLHIWQLGQAWCHVFPLDCLTLCYGSAE